jgi:hypothetical protein
MRKLQEMSVGACNKKCHHNVGWLSTVFGKSEEHAGHTGNDVQSQINYRYICCNILHEYTHLIILDAYHHHLGVCRLL